MASNEEGREEFYALRHLESGREVRLTIPEFDTIIHALVRYAESATGQAVPDADVRVEVPTDLETALFIRQLEERIWWVAEDGQGDDHGHD